MHGAPAISRLTILYSEEPRGIEVILITVSGGRSKVPYTEPKGKPALALGGIGDR